MWTGLVELRKRDLVFLRNVAGITIRLLRNTFAMFNITSSVYFRSYTVDDYNFKKHSKLVH